MQGLGWIVAALFFFPIAWMVHALKSLENERDAATERRS